MTQQREGDPPGCAIAGVDGGLWGFAKVRYRGLAKNATRSFVALGLANLYLARGVLCGQVRS